MKKITFVIIGVALFLFCPFVHGANNAVIIPLKSTQQPGSPDKVWGQGRPGITTLSHEDPNGYCTTTQGVNFALSTHFATWGNAATVCPKDAWVCTADEIGSTICNITINPFASFNLKRCDGIMVPSDASEILTSVWGWLADAHVSLPLNPNPLFSMCKDSDQDLPFPVDYCNAMRVWCCWE